MKYGKSEKKRLAKQNFTLKNTPHIMNDIYFFLLKKKTHSIFFIWPRQWGK